MFGIDKFHFMLVHNLWMEVKMRRVFRRRTYCDKSILKYKLVHRGVQMCQTVHCHEGESNGVMSRNNCFNVSMCIFRGGPTMNEELCNVISMRKKKHGLMGHHVGGSI